MPFCRWVSKQKEPLLLMQTEERNNQSHPYHYEWTSRLWSLLCSPLEVSWVCPGMVKELLLGWRGSSLGKKHKKMQRVAPFILVYMERENRKEDLEYSNLAPKDHFLKIFFFWSREECVNITLLFQTPSIAWEWVRLYLGIVIFLVPFLVFCAVLLRAPFFYQAFFK